jgi:hypothetical protein
MPTERTGPGTAVHPGPPRPRGWQGTRAAIGERAESTGPAPAVVAEHLARMRVAARASRVERKAEQRRWLESLSGLSLDALRVSTPARLWSVAMLHLGGYDATSIARAIGYGDQRAAAKALKHPAVTRIIALVREAQLERVMRGEYGVQAQAKAAAPAVMEHVAELAGGRKDKATGERKGRAWRDSDALRAAELTLTVSGDKVERKASVTFHIFEQMSDAELESLAVTGAFPERFRNVAGYLPGATGGEGEE